MKHSVTAAHVRPTADPFCRVLGWARGVKATHQSRLSPVTVDGGNVDGQRQLSGIINRDDSFRTASLADRLARPDPLMSVGAF
jgi:hypothetical protein